MPTGYTYQLEEMNYDVRKWLTEVIPRAMGMCVMLREESDDLSKDQIRQKLVESESSYYSKSLKKLTAELKEEQLRSDKKWKGVLEKNKQKDIKNHENRIKEWNEKRENHISSLNEIIDIQIKAKNANCKIANDCLKFASQQLETVINSEYCKEYEPKLSSIQTKTWQEYKEDIIDNTKEDIVYYKKHLKDDKDRIQGRLKAFDEYTNFVESFLKKEPND